RERNHARKGRAAAWGKSRAITAVTKRVCDHFRPGRSLAHFIEVKGEPTREQQSLPFVMTKRSGADWNDTNAAGTGAHSPGEPFHTADIARALDRRRQTAWSPRQASPFSHGEAAAQ